MINLDYWFFFLLALMGAIVANATGAGGGVIFVPAFHLLGVSAESIIATSFAIQCFGMTAGTLAWRRLANQRLRQTNGIELAAWQQYKGLIIFFAPPAIAGVVLGQYVFAIEDLDLVKQVFKVFSFGFGLAILATTYWLWRRGSFSNLAPVKLAFRHRCIAIITSLIGGIITAWLSIGVGELIAVLLILWRFPVRLAIGVAVSISAVSVWTGIQYYLWIEPLVYLPILVFAAPAAVIGGTVAKHLVSRLSPVQLKSFIAVWILISAVAM